MGDCDKGLAKVKLCTVLPLFTHLILILPRANVLHL